MQVEPAAISRVNEHLYIVIGEILPSCSKIVGTILSGWGCLISKAI